MKKRTLATLQMELEGAMRRLFIGHYGVQYGHFDEPYIDETEVRDRKRVIRSIRRIFARHTAKV